MADSDTARRVFSSLCKRTRFETDDDGIALPNEQPIAHGTMVVPSTTPPGPLVLSSEQLERMQKQREEAERRLTLRKLETPVQGQTRPGANDTVYSYNTADDVLQGLNDALGADGWGHAFTNYEYEVEQVRANGGNEPRHEHYASVRVKLTATIGDKTVTHEATGGAVRVHPSRFTGKLNAIKSAESDAIKRAARCLGVRFATVPQPSPGPYS